MTTPVNLLVEGFVDETIMHRLMAEMQLPLGTTYGKYGKANLLENLPRYNQAARHHPWVVVVDLDQDAECAPDYVTDILPHPAPQMCLRVAVRAVEAWLLADAERMAAFLDVPRNRMPTRPDEEDNPKATLVGLARRSRSRAIREDMAPREGSGAQVGPGYVGRVVEFVTAHTVHRWRPVAAAERSDSLRRCLDTLEQLSSCL
jgi:hypothetical protein